MYKNPRIIISILLLILLQNFSGAQEKFQTKESLDSLFNSYLKLKNHKETAENKIAGISNFESPNKCGFEITADIKINFDKFTPEQQNLLKTLTNRPETEFVIASPSGKFLIHFNNSGNSFPNYDSTKTPVQNAEQIALIADSVYFTEVENFGFPMTPPDFGIGGDDRYDIYILNNFGSYGYTEFETAFTNQQNRIRYTTFLVIDNDYSKDEGFPTTGFDGARVTLAHEFHHAIQLGNYFFQEEDLFFYEMTSTSMEEFVYDEINDYYHYQNNFFRFPQRALNKYDGYEIAIWNIFLYERFLSNEIQTEKSFFDVIKRQWELLDNNRALEAINVSLMEAGTSFGNELNLFGAWNYFTNKRAIYGKYYEEAENYPLLRIPNAVNFTPPFQKYNLTISPSSNSYSVFSIDAGANGNSMADTLIVISSNSNAQAANIDPLPLTAFSISLFNFEEQGSKKIAGNYFIIFESDELNFVSESEILNNVFNPAVNQQNELAEAFPNPFQYEKNSFLYFPAPDSKFDVVNLYIYTPSMNLVFQDKEQIINFGDKKSVRWNGLDNTSNSLPAGVYIFVVESGGNIKKGKIAILK